MHVPLNVPLARAAFERTEDGDFNFSSCTNYLSLVGRIGEKIRHEHKARVGLEFKTTEAAKGTKTESPCPRSHAS